MSKCCCFSENCSKECLDDNSCCAYWKYLKWTTLHSSIWLKLFLDFLLWLVAIGSIVVPLTAINETQLVRKVAIIITPSLGFVAAAFLIFIFITEFLCSWVLKHPDRNTQK